MKATLVTKRTGTLIFALLLLASCSGEKEISGDTAKNNTDTDAPVPMETEETRMYATLPADLSFADEDFTFLGVGTGFLYGYYSTTDLWTESETGEALNDAIFKRNLAVQELLDITIKVVDFDDAQAEIRRSVTAGETLYDAVWAPGHTSLGLSASGCYLNFRTLPYIDLQKPWWDQNIQTDYSFYGKNFVMTGDISTREDACTYTLVFNKKMLADHSLPSPYMLVEEDSWTFDRFSEMVQAVSIDVNGDGMMTDGDIFGLYGETGAINRLYSSLGGTFYRATEEGDYTITVTDERNIDIYDKIFALYSNDQCVPNIEKWKYTGSDGNVYGYARSVLFAEDKFLFVLTGPLCYVEFRDMESPFGIVPIPKFDESSARYYAVVDHIAPLLSVPVSISSPEKTGVVLEAMACESKYTVTPEYNETLLRRKLARDAESAKMLDIIADSRTYSVMSMTDWGGIYSVAGNAYASGKMSISVSDFEKKIKGAVSAMDKALEKLAELET